MSETNQPIPLTDLRIGNYVNWIYSKNIMKIICIRYNGLINGIKYDSDPSDDGDVLFHAGDYFGIPLTEEWLEKLGFEKGGYFGRALLTRNSKNISIVYYDGIHFYVRQRGGNDFKLPFIEHVHQLQNIIYFLTGKELNISDISPEYIVTKPIEFHKIPITEEWLLKLGFSKEGDFYKHDSSPYQMFQDEILYTNPSYWIPCSKKLKNVHELMFAWYWITGTELTIK